MVLQPVLCAMCGDRLCAAGGGKRTSFAVLD
eukprot:SAG11_NODE_19205_length_472_cov_0.498660_1_plen_30_part_01